MFRTQEFKGKVSNGPSFAGIQKSLFRNVGLYSENTPQYVVCFHCDDGTIWDCLVDSVTRRDALGSELSLKGFARIHNTVGEFNPFEVPYYDMGTKKGAIKVTLLHEAKQAVLIR